MWVDTIGVFSAGLHKKFHFNISRKGLITFLKGRLDVIFSDVLEDVVSYSRDRREQFRHRSRRILGQIRDFLKQQIFILPDIDLIS